MMKVPIARAKVTVTGQFRTTGSVLAGTIHGSCVGIQSRLQVESDAPKDQVLHVLRQAENGCYAMQTIRNPVEVESIVELNGESIALFD